MTAIEALGKTVWNTLPIFIKMGIEKSVEKGKYEFSFDSELIRNIDFNRLKRDLKYLGYQLSAEDSGYKWKITWDIDYERY